MNTLMIFQSVSAVETLATLIAFVTPLATMNKAMLIKDRSGKETFATNQAMIRSLPSVALPYVVIEIGAYGEFTATVLLLTDEGLHTCVSNEWMNVIQITLSWQLSPLLTLVEAQMLPQVTGLCIRLSANIAQILTHSPHCRHVAIVAQFFFTLLFIEMLLLVVRQNLVRVLKVDGTELARQQQSLTVLTESRKVVIAAVSVDQQRLKD